ncbi:MAG: hypothetical protein M9953_13815 [Thermomicrobiales bacterium]|nr:hypothetical protein [Thermomicrobiales bacterium]
MSSIHNTTLPLLDPEDGVRFGRTLLRAQCRGWSTSQLDAVILPANQRGLSGVNLTGGGRIDGGPDVEREVMTRAPLTLGTAVVTGPGVLATHRFEHIVHAVVTEQLGDPPRESSVRQAAMASMRELERIRARNVGFLPFGSGMTTARLSRTQSIPVMLEEIVGHLRRSSSRIELVSLLCNSASEVADVVGLLERIRRELWGRSL